MKQTILVNHLRSGTISLFFISHIIEVVFVVFVSIFLLGPAITFIISGLLCAFFFLRPHVYLFLAPYKKVFHLADDDFFMHELKLNFWFWFLRVLMIIITLGQIITGSYFLAKYGFLNQNLIYLILNK